MWELLSYETKRNDMLYRRYEREGMGPSGSIHHQTKLNFERSGRENNIYRRENALENIEEDPDEIPSDDGERGDEAYIDRTKISKVSPSERKLMIDEMIRLK